MQSVVILSDIMLNVVAPGKDIQKHGCENTVVSRSRNGSRPKYEIIKFETGDVMLYINNLQL
jgi:hypothetical protein